MTLYPPCKINIGLDVLRKRADGFHDIDTLMLPVMELCDRLEINTCDEEQIRLSGSGIVVDCPPEKNIVTRAWQLMRDRYGIGGVEAHLHKVTPFGAGLGGGSADGAFMIRGLNDLFSLGLTDMQMESLASELGSDTAFFIRCRPALATGRGEILTPFPIDLAGKHLVIIKPDVAVSTAQAYAGINPHSPLKTLSLRLAEDISQWKGSIENIFEQSVFRLHPLLAEIKETLYNDGAIYASMSGSGSAIYGIFNEKPRLDILFSDMFVHQEIIPQHDTI